MKKLLLAVVLGLTGLCGAQQGAKMEKPIGAMGWLVGGAWTADAGQFKIETHYTWADNHAFVKFYTHFISEKGTQNRYDGNFYWDPEAKTIRMWYMDAENAIYQGPVTPSGDTTTFDFRGEDFEGKMSDLRVVLTKKTNDLYHWQLSEKGSEGWKELAGLDFKRS